MTNRPGACGLRLDDLSASHRLMNVPETWIPWQHRVVVERNPTARTQSWSDTRAVLQLTSGGVADVDRAASTTTLYLAEAPSDEALIHPHLAMTAVVTSQWNGGTTFHGGALCAPNGAWGVLGDREDGKSSTMAWCALNGVDVLADDTVVVRGGLALAGPRCVDLRESAAAHFGAGDDIGVAGTRRRWRLALADVVAEAPLEGWVVLAWGDDIRLRELPADERFARLAQHRAFRLFESAPLSWTHLLALPMVELTRPHDWTQLNAAMSRLLARIARAGGPTQI